MQPWTVTSSTVGKELRCKGLLVRVVRVGADLAVPLEKRSAIDCTEKRNPGQVPPFLFINSPVDDAENIHERPELLFETGLCQSDGNILQYDFHRIQGRGTINSVESSEIARRKGQGAMPIPI